MIVKALSIRAPWAWAILRAGKKIENRPQRYHYRGTILLHAAKGGTAAEYYSAARAIAVQSGVTPPTWEESLRGGIVGAARLVDLLEPIHRDEGWRNAGQFGLVLEEAIELPFRPYKGALGLFRVELTSAEDSALRAAGLVA